MDQIPSVTADSIPSDLRYVDMEQHVPQDGGERPIRKKKKIPSMEDEAIQELALHVYVEFEDATREDMPI